MKRCLSSFAVVILCAAPVFAQAKAKAQNVREIPYDSVPNFLKLPAGLYLGEAVAVATNSKGHLFVYHRSGNTRLFEFDEKGNYVYIINGKNEVERRNITIGEVDEQGVTIASGLSGNEAVVLSAGPFLNPGQKVKPRREAAAR